MMMTYLRYILGSALVALSLGAMATPSSAQATRTWVCGVGDDVNPCSRTAPCKTFAGAISKTATGGEINCLDPAGYGAVTITKSMTIDCTGTFGSVLASGTTGVIVNGAAADVVLRGLSINGATSGINGVRYLQGASLLIENCFITNFKAASPNGNGIIVNNTSGAADLAVVNSVIANNGLTGSAGIQVEPSGSASAKVSIDSSNFINNNVGVRSSTNSTTGAVNITVTDTTAAGSQSHGFVALSGSGVSRLFLNRITSANNGAEGLRSSGANSSILVGSSVVTGNGTGVNAELGGQVQSYGNNQINANTVEGSNPTAIALK